MNFDAMTNFEVVTAAHRARVRAATEHSFSDAGRVPGRRTRRHGIRMRPGNS